VGYLNETVNSEKLLNVIVRTYHSTNDDPEKDQEPGINTATMISVIIPLIILIIIMAIVLFLAIIANRRKEREEEEEIEEIQEIAEDQILESSEDGKALATAPAQVPTEEETTEE
jgi:flagellar biosynthesis/type III secretory pathway M-ring protein FliF/YscJ